MRGKKAKQLRKRAYGPDNSPRFRDYYENYRGQRKADDLREKYQKLKQNA